MTNTHLSTIELEAGFLRRDGNPVAADEIERAARELAGRTTMSDVDTSKRVVDRHVKHWRGMAEEVRLPDNHIGWELPNLLEALAAERDEEMRLRLEWCASAAQALARCDELERLAGDAHELIKRYRKETPLGHQPHMIAHVADEWLESHQRKGE